jgi:hypothetical protein
MTARTRASGHGTTRGRGTAGGTTDRDLHGFFASISSSTAADMIAEKWMNVWRTVPGERRWFSSASHCWTAAARIRPSGTSSHVGYA